MWALEARALGWATVRPCCRQLPRDLGHGTSSLSSQCPLGSRILQLPESPEWSLKSISCCLQITFCFCSSSLPGLLYLLRRDQLTLWRGHEDFQCKTHPPPVPAGFAKNAPWARPSQGNARPGDGALGLFTLRHIITERWIRSYLRSAFSQSSLATQPPRYKYTLEMCTASYSQSNPSEAWGQIPPGSKDVRRSSGPKGVPASLLQGQMWHSSNRTPVILANSQAPHPKCWRSFISVGSQRFYN